MVSLPEDADASPNLIVNSGFEFDEDGVPPYFCNRGAFDWRHYGGAEYEAWTKGFAVDTAEKHSGGQSFRLAVRPYCANVSFYPWRTATRKGAHGVFSGWMKAERPGMEITVSLGPTTSSSSSATRRRRGARATSTPRASAGRRRRSARRPCG